MLFRSSLTTAVIFFAIIIYLLCGYCECASVKNLTHSPTLNVPFNQSILIAQYLKKLTLLSNFKKFYTVISSIRISVIKAPIYVISNVHFRHFERSREIPTSKPFQFNSISVQLEFTLSISAFFLALDHFFNCFSRSIANCGLLNTS